MDTPPTKGRVRDYGMRWGIENMFSDLKSRGFHLELSQIQRPDRLQGLLLVIMIAIHWAISCGTIAKQQAAASGLKKGFKN